MRQFAKPFLTHILSGVLVVLVALQAQALAPALQWGAVAAALVVLAAIASWWTARCADLTRSLAVLERAIVEGEKPSGDSPFEQCAKRLQDHVRRWSQAAAEGRSQAREVDRVLALFDADAEARKQYRSPARQVYNWLSSVGRDSYATMRELIECNQEIDGVAKDVSGQVQAQTGDLTRACREVELLGKDLGDLQRFTEKSQAGLERMLTGARQSREQIARLSQSQQEAFGQLGGVEHTVRQLQDHTAEITSALVTVSEHAARADMLALNASIEAIRLGEEGRSFASVAEEIRKLAHEVSAASESATERIQQADALVDETTKSLAGERLAQQNRQQQLHAVGDQVEGGASAVEEADQFLRKALEARTGQAKRTAEMAASLEGLLAGSDDVCTKISENSWKVRNLTELLSRLMDVLEPLLGASEDEPSRDARGRAIEPATDGSAATPEVACAG